MPREPGGKGDTQRKAQVSDEIVALRWNLAFGTDEEKEDAKARLEMIEWQRALEQLDEYKPQSWGKEE